MINYLSILNSIGISSFKTCLKIYSPTPPWSAVKLVISSAAFLTISSFVFFIATPVPANLIASKSFSPSPKNKISSGFIFNSFATYSKP
ncbi:putative transmembrane protein [Mycoplasma mycoides subsp. mycoides KH3J]|uniref:Hypothetical transmembrane protein n=1 Tax=Mycoplasma mycoides subsp. mycoides SC (strain CCUG 32753 / NCTC 10114 / PG1) TaxID=272632 RepID=Q6MSI3_MYCMS|nr:putative transmembrane protein [Mycoplasma mycoides subsp. mycoides KH3J]PTD34030.1 hypothetical protein MSCa_3970 [Mycoplasma mycoides subsp. mycoides PO-67]CAE77407.1 Hypothetical transmembrane protein [Mycoplasma mycoides subsp. mycoides SC str. PG1]